jgi:hypothetical protein
MVNTTSAQKRITSGSERRTDASAGRWKRKPAVNCELQPLKIRRVNIFRGQLRVYTDLHAPVISCPGEPYRCP